MKIPSAVEQQVAHVAIRMYAALSYLYYEKDVSAVSDAEYDELCKWLLDNYDWLQFYDINGYLDAGQLKCGSGFAISKKVCGQTLDYAEFLAKAIS